MKNMKSKNGEISSTMLISVVLVIIGLLLIGFLIYQIGFRNNVDREACHESVIFRGTLPSIAEEAVPLKCKTEKICLTASSFGGKCAEFGDSKQVNTIKVKTLDDVQKALAENMVSCWSMMGEGKVSIFSQFIAKNYGFGQIYPSCVVCSRVAFDKESLIKAKIDLSKMDLGEYMRTHAVPERDISYLDYFASEGFGGVDIQPLTVQEDITSQVDKLKEAGTDASVEDVLKLETEQISENIQQKNVVDNEASIVFMQISAPTSEGAFLNSMKLAGSILGVSFAVKPSAFKPTNFVTKQTAYGPEIRNSLGQFAKGSSKKITKIGATGLTKGLALFALIYGVAEQGFVAYNRDIAAGYCGSVSSGGKERDGCSVLKLSDYNEKKIASTCSIVESIP